MNSPTVDHTLLAEKSHPDISSLPTTSTAHTDAARLARDRRRATMSRVQHICLVLLTLSLLLVTLCNGQVNRAQSVAVTDAEQFRQLLETIDDDTLHEILHDHFKGKYKHGIFEEDKAALESLHRENAAAATSLVQLAKRQLNGTTVTSTSFIETTQSITITSTSTPVNTPTVVEPTPTTSETTTAPPPPPTTSSTTTPVETTPTPTPTPSTSSTLVPSTSSTTSPSSTFITTTSSTTSAPVTTSQRPTTSRRSSVTEDELTTEIFYTTTLADGAQSVVTRVTVVPATQTTQIQKPTSSRTSADASLQTGNSASTVSQSGWTAGLGFVGAAMMFAL